MTEPTPGPTPAPRRASPAMIVLAVLVILYFTYVLLFARDGQPMALLVIYVLAVLANAVFLAAVVRRWLRERRS